MQNFIINLFITIDQIVQEADKSIITKWPPINNLKIFQELKNSSQYQQKADYAQQILHFFDKLKVELLEKLDKIQKNTINESLKFSKDSNEILKEYQEISKILDLKELLLDKSLNNLQQHSIICRQFISQIESQKDLNIKQLEKLLIQANSYQANLNFEYPNTIKQQLFALIDQITFFNQDLPEIRSNKNISGDLETNKLIQFDTINKNQKTTANLIMTLISNKSNFCSDQFLNELNINIQRLRNEQHIRIFQENKIPIDFSAISEQKFKFLQEYIQHQILMSSDQQYQAEVRKSFEIKQLNSIFNFQMDFFNNQFTNQFQALSYVILPFIKQLNFTNMYTDQDNNYLKRNMINF